jgi:hypothetical protein
MTLAQKNTKEKPLLNTFHKGEEEHARSAQQQQQQEFHESAEGENSKGPGMKMAMKNWS